MSEQRHTTEILCHTQKFHRIKHVAPGAEVGLGNLTAIQSDTGFAVPAEDKPGLIVIGVAQAFTNSGKLVTKTGAFKFDNGLGSEACTTADINRIVYVLDDHTVGRIGGTNRIPAGVLRDIDFDDQLIIEVGNIVIG